MTTDHELDEIIRSAIHAAADSVEPAGDGLQRIRSKLDKPRWQLQLQLWLTECADLARLIGIRLAPRLARCAGRVRQAGVRLAPAVSVAVGTALTAWAWLRGSRHWLAGRPDRSAPGDSRPRHGAAHRSPRAVRLASVVSGLRPALAVAGAVVVVVAGVLGLFQLRQGVTSIDLLGGRGRTPAAGASTAAPSPGHSSVAALPPAPTAMTPAPRAASRQRAASPTPACTPGASSAAPASSPTPVSSTSPTDSPSATPSPADSTSPSPQLPVPSTPGASTSPAAKVTSSSAPVRLAPDCSSAAPAGGSAASSPVP